MIKDNRFSFADIPLQHIVQLGAHSQKPTVEIELNINGYFSMDGLTKRLPGLLIEFATLKEATLFFVLVKSTMNISQDLSAGKNGLASGISYSGYQTIDAAVELRDHSNTTTRPRIKYSSNSVMANKTITRPSKASFARIELPNGEKVIRESDDYLMEQQEMSRSINSPNFDNVVATSQAMAFDFVDGMHQVTDKEQRKNISGIGNDVLGKTAHEKMLDDQLKRSTFDIEYSGKDNYEEAEGNQNRYAFEPQVSHGGTFQTKIPNLTQHTLQPRQSDKTPSKDIPEESVQVNGSSEGSERVANDTNSNSKWGNIVLRTSASDIAEVPDSQCIPTGAGISDRSVARPKMDTNVHQNNTETEVIRSSVISDKASDGPGSTKLKRPRNKATGPMTRKVTVDWDQDLRIENSENKNSSSSKRQKRASKPAASLSKSKTTISLPSKNSLKRRMRSSRDFEASTSSKGNPKTQNRRTPKTLTSTRQRRVAAVKAEEKIAIANENENVAYDPDDPIESSPQEDALLVTDHCSLDVAKMHAPVLSPASGKNDPTTLRKANDSSQYSSFKNSSTISGIPREEITDRGKTNEEHTEKQDRVNKLSNTNDVKKPLQSASTSVIRKDSLGSVKRGQDDQLGNDQISLPAKKQVSNRIPNGRSTNKSLSVPETTKNSNRHNAAYSKEQPTMGLQQQKKLTSQISQNVSQFISRQKEYGKRCGAYRKDQNKENAVPSANSKRLLPETNMGLRASLETSRNILTGNEHRRLPELRGILKKQGPTSHEMLQDGEKKTSDVEANQVSSDVFCRGHERTEKGPDNHGPEPSIQEAQNKSVPGINGTVLSDGTNTRNIFARKNDSSSIREVTKTQFLSRNCGRQRPIIRRTVDENGSPHLLRGNTYENKPLDNSIGENMDTDGSEGVTTSYISNDASSPPSLPVEYCASQSPDSRRHRAVDDKSSASSGSRSDYSPQCETRSKGYWNQQRRTKRPRPKQDRMGTLGRSRIHKPRKQSAFVRRLVALKKSETIRRKQRIQPKHYFSEHVEKPSFSENASIDSDSHSEMSESESESQGRKSRSVSTESNSSDSSLTPIEKKRESLPEWQSALRESHKSSLDILLDTSKVSSR